MNEEFNLIYHHKETGKVVYAKWVTRHDFIVLDPETQTKMPLSRYALEKAYRADEKNKKRKIKNQIKLFKKEAS